MITTKKRGGLANVVAGDSNICLCGATDESLLIRGYSIEDLAQSATFEEVVFLLLAGRLPKRGELFEGSYEVDELFLKVPQNASPMDFLRTAVSLAGTLWADEPNPALRLITSLPTILLSWMKQKKLPLKRGSIAKNFLELLHEKEATAKQIRALDISLILYSEHEFNASTFVVRTIASTMSDYYSAICGGIGALAGPLHGGANERAYDLIHQFKSADEAEKKILEMLSQKIRIMGFGHRVYTTKDPRSDIIKNIAQSLASAASDSYLFEVANRIEEVMWHEKMLFPNLDFYSALVYHWLDIPKSLFTPLFVLSRLSGWSAHFIEQQSNNKLIRPLSNYTGPKHQPWIPLEER